jgi:hypothetical protein
VEVKRASVIHQEEKITLKVITAAADNSKQWEVAGHDLINREYIIHGSSYSFPVSWSYQCPW